VVVVFQGRKGSSDYEVDVERIMWDENTNVVIRAKFKKPQEGQEVFNITTSPYHIVRVEKPD